MNITLANGSEGYIPPPEQFPFGGYNTWPARTAALVPEAETRITQTLLELLEDVSGRARRDPAPSHGPYARAVLNLEPLAYWRMEEFGGPTAQDATGRGHHGRYEQLIAFHLDGPDAPAFRGDERTNRAVHFGGGRMRARIDGLGDRYTVSLWFWSGMDHDLRAVTGYLFSRGEEGDPQVRGDHLGVSGADGPAGPGRLFLRHGAEGEPAATGVTRIEPRRWYHAVLVRDGAGTRLYLDGELEAETDAGEADRSSRLFLGGRSDGAHGWPGRLDEVALFDRPLSRNEVEALHRAASQR